MQTVSEVMSRNARVVSPHESLQRAAQLMDELDVGALPVCDGERLVGMITDRDITIRAVAAGKPPQEAHVEDVMSADVRWCFEDQPLDEVMTQMADSQIRRIPVLSHDEQKRLVGIVSLGDLATRTDAGGAQKQQVEQVVEMVSSPAGGDGPAIPPDQIAGRSGSGTAGAAATGTGSAGMAGLDVPRAGESDLGVAGASGEPRREGDQPVRTGATNDTRRNFGVGGQDLTQGGLPPA